MRIKCSVFSENLLCMYITIFLTFNIFKYFELITQSLQNKYVKTKGTSKSQLFIIMRVFLLCVRGHTIITKICEFESF